MSYIDEQSPLLRAVLLVAGLVIIAAGMKATATVVNLILLSILLATTLVPLTVILTQRGMGRGAAIALTAILALVGGALLIMVLTRSISRLSENLPTYQAALGGLVDNVTDKLAARGIAVDQAMKPDPAKIMGRVGGLLGAALGLVGYGLLAIVLVVLFLIEMPVISAGDAGPGSVRQRLDQAMRLVRRFVGLNGLIGVIIAVFDLAIMLLMGTDGAVLWAVICFLFAFVPFGFMLSMIPPLDSHPPGARRRPGGRPLRPLLRRQLHRRQRDQAQDHGLRPGTLPAPDRDRAAGLGRRARAHGGAARDPADPRGQGNPADLHQPAVPPDLV